MTTRSPVHQKEKNTQHHIQTCDFLGGTHAKSCSEGDLWWWDEQCLYDEFNSCFTQDRQFSADNDYPWPKVGSSCPPLGDRLLVYEEVEVQEIMFHDRKELSWYIKRSPRKAYGHNETRDIFIEDTYNVNKTKQNSFKYVQADTAASYISAEEARADQTLFEFSLNNLYPVLTYTKSLEDWSFDIHVSDDFVVEMPDPAVDRMGSGDTSSWTRLLLKVQEVFVPLLGRVLGKISTVFRL